MDTILIIWFKNSKSVSSNHDKIRGFKEAFKTGKKKNKESQDLSQPLRWVVELVECMGGTLQDIRS
jgi:hypothetical protein